jgi:apoptosis-inducing factor 3
MREVELAKVGDLKDGEMRACSAGETKVLLARVNGRFHAVGATCPHYGAPLAEGALCGERIICPWHHGSFDVTSGNLLEPPALDALPCYEVRVEDGHVIALLPDEAEDRRTPPMAKGDTRQDDRTFVILGGGAAGYMAAQTLREEQFQGRILMLTREDRLPYDRPNLSKDYLHGHADPEWMPLRHDDFFSEHKIEVWRGREVARVDAQKKTILFKGGAQLVYNALLAATGGEPRTLPVSGSELMNVLILRSFSDADSIIAAAESAKRAVVIGASFIGMEAAFSLRTRGLEVTVVAPERTPFERTLGAEIGALFQKIHESNGVQFRLGARVRRIIGANQVEAVALETGDKIEADLVVVGVGVRPATDLLAGVTLHEDGGVIVDSHLRAADSLYAAGDIARFTDVRTKESSRIEHWRTALQQGRTAARNMAGHETVYDSVPFFWTTQFDTTLAYVGHAAQWDEIIFDSQVEEKNFLAFYVKGDQIRAVAGMNRDREMAMIEDLMRNNDLPAPSKLRSGKIDLEDLIRRSR